MATRHSHNRLSINTLHKTHVAIRSQKQPYSHTLKVFRLIKLFLELLDALFFTEAADQDAAFAFHDDAVLDAFQNDTCSGRCMNDAAAAPV